MGDAVKKRYRVGKHGWGAMPLRIGLIAALCVVGMQPIPVAAQGVDAGLQAAPEPAGSADTPRSGPSPEGVLATRVQEVTVEEDGAATAIHVRGDGEFDYSTFRLSDPDRFVVDLAGVVNGLTDGYFSVGANNVEQVRVAQFRGHPDPVMRVVIDLDGQAIPSIERRADELVLTFGSPAPQRVAEVAAEAPQLDSRPADVAVERTAEAAVESAAEPEAEPEAETPAAWMPAATQVAVDEPETVQPTAVDPAPVATVAAPADLPPIEVVAAVGPTDLETTSEVELYEAAQVEMDAPPPAAVPAPSGVVREAPSFDSRTVSGGGRVYRGEPMTLTLRDADIKDVLRSFAKISGLNVVVQPGVSGKVTVELTQVPWDQALEQILKINGLDYELEGNIMRIAPVAVLQQEASAKRELEAIKAQSVPLRTVMKRISYGDPNEISQVLQRSVMSQRGSVVVDRRTNTLIIKELPAFMDVVISVIENLDTPEPQVMIEARIVETTKRFERTLGIEWNFLGISDAAHGNTTGLEFPNNGSVEGGVNLLTGANNGFLSLSLGNVLSTFQLDATLNAAENEGLINILSAPKVATLNNEQASIQSGLQIPIQTIANNTVSVQFVNATLRLDVTPHVTAEGTVLMEINIQKREPQLAFAVVGATNAPISTKEARTKVIVRDGGTTVIGGIYEVSTDQGSDRVPGFADIPIIGGLFKNKRRTDENKELLIFITPRVIKL